MSYDATPESADDALYTVRHLGGESRFAVNQTMGGGTWVYLGRFLFDAGMQEAVTLSNRSRRAGRIVSADAVKIGGGYGNVARAVADTLARPGGLYRAETSGYPRYCEGARYWLQWAGFDERVYTPKGDLDDYKDDFMSRALWVNTLMGGSERLRDSAGLGIPLDLALAFHSDSGVRDGDETIGTLGIFFTRDKDGRLSLGERVRFANAVKGDLFISIHVNANRNSKISGFETYFLNFASSNSAARVAAVENAVGDRNLGSLEGILADIVLGARTQESRHLANNVQRHTLRNLKREKFVTKDGGVRSAPFFVLMGSGMPGVLIELGYCTNPGEAKRLKRNDYLNALAVGIANGIASYAEQLNP